jgi:hypothetical protein
MTGKPQDHSLQVAAVLGRYEHEAAGELTIYK